MIDIIFLTGSMGGAMIYFSTFHMKDDNDVRITTSILDM